MINDTIGPKGEVVVEIIRATGEKEKYKRKSNTIQAELKNVLAQAMITQITGGFGCLSSAFSGQASAGDNLITPPTTGESGIYLIDSGSPTTYYEMTTTLDSSTSSTMVIKGIINSGQTKTFSSVVLGHHFQSGSPGNFVYEFSTFDFSTDPSVDDGDTLTVAWTIQIADN